MSEACSTLGDADRLELFSGRVPGGTGELDAPPGLPQQCAQGADLGEEVGATIDPLRMELEHHVPLRQAFARRQVADPVVGHVGSHQDQLPGAEDVDAVPDHVPAGAGSDQVDLVLGMMVPAGERARHPMAMPTRGVVRVARHHLARGLDRREPVRDLFGLRHALPSLSPNEA